MSILQAIALAAAALNVIMAIRFFKQERRALEERIHLMKAGLEVMSLYDRLGLQMSAHHNRIRTNEAKVERLAWLRDQHMTGDRLTDDTDETLFLVSRPANGGEE